jgi:hypothetical protein
MKTSVVLLLSLVAAVSSTQRRDIVAKKVAARLTKVVRNVRSLAASVCIAMRRKSPFGFLILFARPRD